MEKEGLIHGVEFLRGYDFSIATLVTDRHPQVRKWMREEMPDTQHYYDVWHVAKVELHDKYDTTSTLQIPAS